MDIYRAEKLAQDYVVNHPGWDKKFLLIAPAGIIPCTWLDPYFGFFTFDGKDDGFVRTKDIPASVEVVMPDPAESD